MSTLDANAELQKLNPRAIVTLYEIDATEIGGDFFRFYPGTDANQLPVVWRGNTYIPFPMDTRGFDFKGQGAPPRPSLFMSNVGGQVSSLCLAFDDLIGAKLIRKRTWAHCLDGLPTASPGTSLPDDVFFFEQKISETRLNVEFELATNMVVDDLQLPRRKVLANLCQWIYRSAECSYAGGAVGDVNDVPLLPNSDIGFWTATTPFHVGDSCYVLQPNGTRRYFWCWFDNAGAGVLGAVQGPPNPVFWKKDECSKRVSGCELRFTNNPQGLPFGGFPGTKRLG